METINQAALIPDSQDSNASERGAPDVLFGLRIAGMLLIGSVLALVPQISRADTSEQNVPASHRECHRTMSALIQDSKGSATKVEVSSISPRSSMARILVSDGELRIICDDESGRMIISRSVGQSTDTEQAQTVSLAGY